MEVKVVQVETEEQLQKCLDVRLKVFVVEQKVPRDLEVDEFDESPSVCRHVLLEIDGRAAAAGRTRLYGDGRAKIQRVAVLPDYRSQGIGRVLMGALEQAGRELGAAEAVLDAQCDAELFYRKLGYTVVSTEPFLDAGIWHVRMTKALQ